METERDYIMRQIHRVARDLGNLLTKDSIKEYINYDLDAKNALNDQEIDNLLLLSNLLDMIDKGIISQSQVEEELGLSMEDIHAYYHLEKPLPKDLFDKIEAFIQTYPWKKPTKKLTARKCPIRQILGSVLVGLTLFN